MRSVATTRGRSGAGSSPRRRAWLFACALGAAGGAAWGGEAPDADRGRLLYENHCVVCHTSKVHRRFPALAIDPKELRRIVAGWGRESKLSWTASEVEDVAAYLERDHYRSGR